MYKLAMNILRKNYIFQPRVYSNFYGDPEPSEVSERLLPGPGYAHRPTSCEDHMLPEQRIGKRPSSYDGQPIIAQNQEGSGQEPLYENIEPSQKGEKCWKIKIAPSIDNKRILIRILGVPVTLYNITKSVPDLLFWTTCLSTVGS